MDGGTVPSPMAGAEEGVFGLDLFFALETDREGREGGSSFKGRG